MRLLMIYSTKFSYNPTIHTLDEFPKVEKGEEFGGVLVAFIHAEEQDEENAKGVETKLLKNLKWAAKKNNTKKVVLHSFAHLAETKANPHFTKEIFRRSEQYIYLTRFISANPTDEAPFSFCGVFDL